MSRKSVGRLVLSRPSGDGSDDWNAAVAELMSRRNGSAVGLRHWWERMRRSIIGRDS